jgi:hypothetical protein
MGGQWKKPQTFYLKYEAKHIGHEIEELKEEQKYMKYLTNYMLENDMATREDLGLPPEEKIENVDEKESH